MSILTRAIDLSKPVSDHPLNSGLVSWWLPLRNNSGGSRLFDLCNRNHGELTSGPTWGVGPDGLPVIQFTAASSHRIAIAKTFPTLSADFFISAVIRGTSSGTQVFYGPYDFSWWFGYSSGNLSWNGSITEGSSSVNDGKYHHVIASRVSGTLTLYTDGISRTSGAAATSFTNGGIGLGTFGSGGFYYDGNMTDIRYSNGRGLSALGAHQLYEEWKRGYPNTLRRVPSRIWSFGSIATAGSYTLTMDAGSYGVTGQAVALKASRQLASASGSYSLTGQAVALKAGRKVAVVAGSYSLTGSAVALKADRELASASGSYTLTGQDTGLKAGRKIAVASGSYTLTGQDVALNYSGSAGSYTLAIESGSYALTGSSVGLIAARVLGIGTEAYSLTGSAVGLKAGRQLAVGAASYALNGFAVALKAARQIAALSGSYTLTGQDITFTYTPAAVDLLSGLGAYYRLDGDLTDSSGNGRDLSASGTPTYAAAKLNTGLTANGGTYALSGWLTGTNAASVSFWVKGIAAFDGSGGQVGDGNEFVVRYDSDSGSGGFLTFQGNPVNSPGDFVAGTWYHVAVTYAGGTLGAVKAYINGTLAYTDTGTINWDTTLTVNATGDQSSPLDEVAVYTRAITAAEVSALYNSGLGYDPTNVGPVSRFTIAGTDRSRVTIPGIDRSRVTVAGTLRN